MSETKTQRRPDFRACGHGREGSAPDPDRCDVCAEIGRLRLAGRSLNRRIERLYRIPDRDGQQPEIRRLQEAHADVISRLWSLLMPPLPAEDTDQRRRIDELLAKYKHLVGDPPAGAKAEDALRR